MRSSPHSRFDSATFAELFTNEAIILGQERPGKVLVEMREVTANDAIFSYSIYAFVSKVAKTLAQIVELVNTGASTETGQG